MEDKAPFHGPGFRVFVLGIQRHQGLQAVADGPGNIGYGIHVAQGMVQQLLSRELLQIQQGVHIRLGLGLRKFCQRRGGHRLQHGNIVVPDAFAPVRRGIPAEPHPGVGKMPQVRGGAHVRQTRPLLQGQELADIAHGLAAAEAG